MVKEISSKKPSKTNTLMALIIIIAMIGSTLAFGVLSAPDKNQTPVENLPPLENSGNLTVLKYSAENVKAKVSDLLPSIRFVADTNKTDIDSMDAEIREIEGVRSVSSNFLQPNANQPIKSLTYVGQVSFEKELDASQLIELIKEKLSFEKIEAVRFSLVELPKTVKLFNKDLNLSEDYTFKETLSEALVGLETQKGDSIEVELNVSLKGKDLTELIAYESQNLENQFVSHSLKEKAKISELKPELFFSADYNISLEIDSNELEKQIKAIKDFNSIDLSKQQSSQGIEVKINSINATLIQNDINSTISALSGVKNLALSVSDGNKSVDLLVEFVETANVTELLQNISTKLVSLGFSQSEFELTEPIVRLTAKISLLSGNASAFYSELQKILSEKNLPKVEILQNADSNAQFLTDSGKKFALDENKFTMLVKPTHSVGEDVNAEISFYTQRDKVLFASAVEAENS